MSSVADVDFLKKAGFLLYVSTVSIVGGFGLTLARAKKSSPNAFNNVNSEGARLALKAFGIGTLINVGAFGVVTFTVCKVMGVSGPKEFGSKMKEILPEKDGEFVHKFDDWPTKLPVKPDDGKWRDEFK